jgi:hypothetical protein
MPFDRNIGSRARVAIVLMVTVASVIALSINQMHAVDPVGPIRNGQSGRCLDADLDTIGRNGTTVQLFDCWGGNNQKWDIDFG